MRVIKEQNIFLLFIYCLHTRKYDCVQFLSTCDYCMNEFRLFCTIVINKTRKNYIIQKISF